MMSLGLKNLLIRAALERFLGDRIIRPADQLGLCRSLQLHVCELLHLGGEFNEHVAHADIAVDAAVDLGASIPIVIILAGSMLSANAAVEISVNRTPPALITTSLSSTAAKTLGGENLPA